MAGQVAEYQYLRVRVANVQCILFYNTPRKAPYPLAVGFYSIVGLERADAGRGARIDNITGAEQPYLAKSF